MKTKQITSVDLFKSLEIIRGHLDFKGQFHQAIGFNRGRLSFCDGETLNPISVKEALEWLAAMEVTAEQTEMDGEIGEAKTLAKWYQMIAVALR